MSLTFVINGRIVAGFFLFALAIACAVSTTFVMFAMIGELNRKLPDTEQIGYIGAHPQKYKHIRDSYRRLYPGGGLERLYWVLAGASFVLGLSAAVLIGIVRLPF
ncbi:MAG: hypothetical protein JOZ72_03540 [Alphaproteobacteria bacterium]|nr:hypothetical protein [Alphaproteobacteria bacterium]